MKKSKAMGKYGPLMWKKLKSGTKQSLETGGFGFDV